MLSRPFTTGAIMLVVAGAFAGGLWQGQQTRDQASRISQLPDVPPVPEAGPVIAPEAVADTPAPVAPAEPVVQPEPEVAVLPDPEPVIVPQPAPQPEAVAVVTPPVAAPTPAAAPAPTGPIVTVNGRPLGVDRVILPAPDGSTAPRSTEPRTVATTPATPVAQPPVQQPATTTPDSAVAVLVPPRPIPRPEGLSVPSTQYSGIVPPRNDIDYEAIAAAAYGQPDDEFMSYEQRMALQPIGGELVGRVGDPIPFGPAPRDSGLVQVVGPNGEILWVYEDQLRGNSSVTFRNQPSGNDYGFIYDDDRYYRW